MCVKISDLCIRSGTVFYYTLSKIKEKKKAVTEVKGTTIPFK